MNTTSDSVTKAVQDATAILTDLLNLTVRVGRNMVATMSRSGMSMLGGMVDCCGAVTKISRPIPCGCAIPPACWAPQPIGELISHVCPGGTATVRLRITNGGIQSRSIGIEVQGKGTALTVTPPTLMLAPMERGVAVASMPVPADAASGQEFESLVWVRGCQDHYLRWTGKIASRGADCCHEIEVEDCPDLVHHWYDHFYCARSCFGQKRG
jgi:hypothetical protein